MTAADVGAFLDGLLPHQLQCEDIADADVVIVKNGSSKRPQNTPGSYWHKDKISNCSARRERTIVRSAKFLSDYSFLSATMGSTELARLAGM